MEDRKKLEAARSVMRLLCRTLDEMDWKYIMKNELSISTGARGDSLPIDLMVNVDKDRGLIMLISMLPFAIKEDKRIETAVGVAAVNNTIANGYFDYDISSGRLLFRMVTSYLGMSLSKEVIKYLMLCSCQTIDAYSDKFLMLAKGIMTIEEFIKAVKV